MNAAQQLYADMGVRPVINALGNRTLLGGSSPSPPVLDAMRLAGRYYVDMDDLLESTGCLVSSWLDCEAALITPGCAAALVIGTAACITGTNRAHMDQLPNTTGLPNEVVLQRGQRYKYDRVVRLPGTRLVTPGTESATTEEDLATAIGPRTACVLYPATDSPGDLLTLDRTIAIAHQYNIPVLVDAAYRVYPLDGLRYYTDKGADLVGYGAKYFGAPNSTGLLCGRQDLIEAARHHSFASFEKHESMGIGRPFKVDRQEVIGVVIALRHWLDMDHDARRRKAHERGQSLRRSLEGLSGLRLPANNTADLSTLSVSVNEDVFGKTSGAIVELLKEGNPSIWLRAGPSQLEFWMFSVEDGDEEIIADRLRNVAGS